MTPLPPRSPLFPYTTLFRSALLQADRLADQHRGRRRLGHERERAVLVDRDHDRDRHAHVVGGLGVERSEERTSELQSPVHLVCRLLLEKKKMSPNTNMQYVS